MPKTLSKRAIEGRKWRVAAREKRRVNTIVTEYVKIKHKEVYDECVNFYDNIAGNYSEKQNLTKTEEFHELVSDTIQTDEAQECSVEVDQTMSNVIETVIDEKDDEPASEAEDGEPVSEADETVEESRIEPAASEVVTIGDTYVEPGLILNNYIVQPQEDILAQAMSETLGDVDNSYDFTEDMNTIVNEIIDDIEAENPDIFINPNADDEGIGLNFEDEIESVFNEFDIDFNF